MKKNILIIGAPRCGKTTLVNMILKKNSNYEIIRGDALTCSYRALNTRKICDCKNNKENSNNTINLDDISFPYEYYAFYIREIYNNIKFDSCGIKRPVVIETCWLSIKDYLEYFEDEFDIYCLGMPNESPKKLLTEIRNNSDDNDWTNLNGSFTMNMICNEIIEESKQLQKDCEKYNIPFFETNGDRMNKLNEIVDIIL